MIETDKEVRAVIQKYIDATFNGDVKAIKKLFHSKAVMNGYIGNKVLLGGPEPFFQHLESIKPMSETGTPYKANITFLHLVGNVASIIVSETGFASELNFTTYFHLLKDGEEWKIISKTFTTTG